VKTGVEKVRAALAFGCALALPFFTLFEANYPRLTTQGQLAIFALLGIALAYLRERPDGRGWLRVSDLGLAFLAFVVFGYVVVQSEPLFERWWSNGLSLGGRAGAETALDIAIGAIGLVLVLEATRRSIGVALPILALVFVAYARFGSLLPDWLMPHRGYGLERIVGQTFLHSQGVFGVALKVMFSYVFLFVVFGALLEATGATAFIVGAGRRLFSGTTGGPAKVAVFSSGMLGSLSGSAVANTATTGTFTIPMMRSAGFRPALAAGVEAAASSGGALVPPVMGAGAYMMLELVEPQVTYLQIIRAALLPALLYYLSIFLVVHFTARRLEAAGNTALEDDTQTKLVSWEAVVVLGALGSLVALLIAGFTVFRAVSVALVVVLALSALHSRTRLTGRSLVQALVKSASGGVPLIGAAACVGVVIGVVTLTGVGTRLPSLILPLAQNHLLGALLLIMVSSIVLGMGLPSAVCYLLLATLISPILGRLGVVPLAAHLFIFYFGLMSMVTPPVALAAYAASSIAGSRFLETSVAAFRFALVGFALPFMFIYRPQLLMLDSAGGTASALSIVIAVAMAAAGIVPLAAALAGYLYGDLATWERALLLASSALTLFPGDVGSLLGGSVSLANLAGLALLAATVLWRRARGTGRQAAV
jgi:TRAP transporter 4TM/12TM fusion protein